MKYYLSVFLILLMFSGCEKKTTNGEDDQQEECIIEEQFASIQDSIDAAIDGDTVLIQPGTYTGSINFKGKNIVVGSLFLSTGDTSYMNSTIIDANGNGSVVKFENNEGPGAVLAGLTLTGGSAYEGGGIYINGASPTLHQLVITENEVTTCTEGKTTITAAGGGVYMSNSEASFNIVYIIYNKSEDAGGGIFMQSSNPSFRSVSVNYDTAGSDGGGIYVKASTPKMVRMMVCDNVASNGGGIFFSLSSPKLENVLVSRNIAKNDGGGMYLINSGPTAVNITVGGGDCWCTIGNTARRGGGIYMTGSSFNIMNSHLYLDEPKEIYFQGSGTGSSVTVSFSDVEGGVDGISVNDNGTVVWSEGNIEGMPIYTSACDCTDWLTDETGGGLPPWDRCELGLGCGYVYSPGVEEGNPASQYNNVSGRRNTMGWLGGPNGCCAPD